jgi:hypothetical protein
MSLATPIASGVQRNFGLGSNPCACGPVVRDAATTPGHREETRLEIVSFAEPWQRHNGLSSSCPYAPSWTEPYGVLSEVLCPSPILL